MNEQILFLANHYKNHTINSILEKEEGELALDYMMGKVYSPTSSPKEVTPFGPGSTHDLSIFQNPDLKAIQTFYKMKSSSPLVVPPSLADTYQDYVQQRLILNDFYVDYFKEGLEEEIEVISKELGNYDPVMDISVIQNDAEMNVFCDYFSLYRSKNGVRSISDWLEQHKPRLTSENEKVAKGFCDAYFAVLRIDKNLAFGAIQCFDVISQKAYLLIDKALNASKKEGYFFIWSLIHMGDYCMTTGGGILADESPGGKATLTLVARSLDHFRNTSLPFTEAIGDSVRRIYGFCLRNGALTHITANMSF